MWTRRPLGYGRALQTISEGPCLRLARRQRTADSHLTRFQRRRLSSKVNESKAEEHGGAAKNEISSTLKEKLPQVQGPSWLWAYAQQLTYPLRVYNRAQNKNPYLVQLCSSLTIYFLGDLSSQLIERPDPSTTADESDSSDGSSKPQADGESASGFRLNTDRSLRALIIGGVFSIPSYHWFLFLSNNFNIPATVPRSAIWSLALKVAVNQAVFAPVFASYFFGMQSLLSSSPTPLKESGEPVEGKLNREYADAKLDHAWHRITQTVPTAWYNSCKFWPFVTAFSFTFVRPQSRSVFAGLVAIGWQTYLGILNQRAERKKRKYINVQPA